MNGVQSISRIEAQASLGIFGTGLDFDSISQELGVKASYSQRKGDRGLTSRPYPQDLWRLESPLPHREPLDAHLKWLKHTVAPHYDFLHALKKTAQVRSYCGFTADDRLTFRVSGENLRLFTELDIDMELSLVFLGPPDSDVVSEEAEPEGADVNAYECGTGAYHTESEVSLQATGNALDLIGISRALGLKPSEIHRSGDLDSEGKAYPVDLWSIKSPLSKFDELNAHFKWLGMAVLRHSDFIRSLASRSELVVRCNFGTESDTGGVDISPEGLKVCTELGIALEFNVFLI